VSHGTREHRPEPTRSPARKHGGSCRGIACFSGSITDRASASGQRGLVPAMSCLRGAIRSAPRKEAPNAPGRRARADRDGLAGPSRHAPLSTGMSAPDFDPLGPIQARIAVACSGARLGGALLGLSGEGRGRPPGVVRSSRSQSQSGARSCRPMLSPHVWHIRHGHPWASASGAAQSRATNGSCENRLLGVLAARSAARKSFATPVTSWRRG
jgi:hypothetical protein